MRPPRSARRCYVETSSIATSIRQFLRPHISRQHSPRLQDAVTLPASGAFHLRSGRKRRVSSAEVHTFVTVSLGQK